MTRRHTAQDYHDLASLKNFRWLGDESKPINSKTTTLWGCPQGHQWPATYGAIYAGHGCHECYEARRADQKGRKTPEDYTLLASQRDNIIWLGPEVPNTSTVTRWQCTVCQYSWLAPYGNIRTGQGCRKCADRKTAEANRYKPSDYTSIGKAKGFEWLGPEVRLAKEKTNWRCLNGHEFEGPLDKIIQGHGCQECYDMRRGDSQRYGATQYRQLASENNIEWLGSEVKRTDEMTKWRCENGHEFSTTYDTVRDGKGCSRCSQSRGEKRIENILSRYGLRFDIQKRFDKCRSKRALPFDFYLVVNNVQMLIEYDGELHYQKARFDKEGERLRRTQKHDAIKDKFAQDYGFVLIRIPYTRFKEIESILRNEISDHTGIDIWSIELVAHDSVICTSSIDGTQLALF